MNEQNESNSEPEQKKICIISPHETGFWQADVYECGFAEGQTPDWFCTGKRGEDRYAVINKAGEEYPGIKFVAGITGTCPECNEEYFELELHCDCGEELDQL